MKIQFILYVSNQKKSKLFYSKLLDRKPVLDVVGMTEFQISKKTKLGIMPENGIAKILANMPNPSSGNGIPRCELYIYTNSVTKLFAKAITLGAKEVALPKQRDWGDYVAYIADFDGNIIALAQKH